MSNEIKDEVNINMSYNKHISPKMHQVTYQDLIIFKEELLKDLRNYKNKITANINNEFGRYNGLLEKSNQNLNYYEKEKALLMTKIEFTQEKEKLFFDLSNKNNELKNEVMINQVHITACRKDIDDSCYKYDQIISDNLLVPGLIGKSCKYQNLKEYILYNKEEINNALFANRQTSIDLNVLKKKIDTVNGQMNTKLKSLEYRISNFITSKFNEVSQKFDILYDELNKRMNTLNHEVKSNIEERNNELARLKNFVFEENSKAIDDVKNIREEIATEFKKMKNNFKDIKKNIVSLTNLLMGRNFNQNRQYVVTNFNNMMLDLFREFNLAPKSNPRMSLQGNSLTSPAPDMINRKNTLAPNATSFIKKYIEGKITVDETKFNHENKTFKRKKSLQLKEPIKNNFISENEKINKNFGENKIDLNSIFSEKNRISNSEKKYENKGDSTTIKKTFYKRNTTNFIETSKSFKKNEIIQEEDSNKYLSSQSNLSNEDILKKDEKRKISDFEKNNNNINNKNNKTENKEKEIIKRNSFYKDKKSNFNTNSNEEEKIIEFSENSSSYKKIDNSIEASQRNNNITKKILNTNNSDDNSSKPKKSPNIQEKQNNFEIINNYSNVNKNSQNSGEENRKKVDNKIINSDESFNKKRLFNGLMPVTTLNFNIEDKSNIKKLDSPSPTKNIFSSNILQQSNEKFSFLNKINLTNSVNLKNNSDLKDIKESISKIDKPDKIEKTDNILYSYNNSKKSLKEGPKLSLNQINKVQKRKDSPIIIKSREIKDSNKNLNIQNTHNDIIYYTKNINNSAKNKAKFFQLKELKNPKHQKINNNEEKEVENNEVNEQFSSFNKEKNNTNKKNERVEHKLKSAQKQNKRKLKLNKTNIFKDDKEIYLSKDILTSTRYIKDEDIIDKPLLFDMNIFKADKNKGNLENRINELEYFLKKKLDELVKEIKIFIPIHFNSHIRNYTVDKNIK